MKRWLINMSLVLFPCFTVFAQESGLKSEFPIELSVTKGTQSDLIIYLTGDGGWNRFSKNLMNEFEEEGYGVVSLNSLKYFKEQKSPESLARDLTSLAEKYLKKWNKTSLIIVGYSFGADVASFLPRYLSSQLKEKIKKIALLSPSASTDFVVKLGDLLGFSDNENGKYKVRQEIEKSKLPVICVFGKDESLLLKQYLKHDGDLTIYELPGGHRYDDDFSTLYKIITS